MPLKGEARNKYMRDYMRRKRAAERTGSPKRATTKPAGPAPDHAAPGHEARISELEAELKRERNRSKMFEGGLQALRRQQRAESKPKVAKSPLPPDEERERIIKGLKTRVQNLSRELRAFRQYHEDAMTKQGGMSRETRTAIDWVLQPDQRSNATEARWDRAAKGWNVWKNDNDKAQRKAR